MLESYIVRIFRRDEREPEHAIGTVERVENREQIAFHSLSDLIEFLHLSRRRDERDPGEP